MVNLTLAAFHISTVANIGKGVKDLTVKICNNTVARSLLLFLKDDNGR